MMHSKSSALKKQSNNTGKTRLVRSYTFQQSPQNIRKTNNRSNNISLLSLQDSDLNYRMNPRLGRHHNSKKQYHPVQLIKNASHQIKIKDSNLSLSVIEDDQKSIESFVDQITTDPLILHDLVNYKLLVQKIKQRVNHQQSQIQNKKSYIENQYQSFYQIFGKFHRHDQRSKKNNNSIIISKRKLITQQIQKQCEKIQKIIQKQLIFKSLYDQKQLIQQQNIKSLKQKIKEARKDYLLKQAELSSKLKTHKKINNKNKEILFTKQKQAQIKHKSYNMKKQKLASLKNKLNGLQEAINIKRQQNRQLKKIEMEHLKKYKNEMMKKSTNQKQIKVNSQKKLNGIVKDLIKILEQCNMKKFQQFAQNYDVPLHSKKFTIQYEGVRRKNSSADTVPDFNLSEISNSKSQLSQEIEAPKQQLTKMQQQNPALKISLKELMQIKSVEQSEVYIKAISQSRNKTDKNKNMDDDCTKIQLQAFKNQSYAKQERIRELQSEQLQLDGFVTLLKEKLDKKNSELKVSQNARVLLKKTISALIS